MRGFCKAAAFSRKRLLIALLLWCCCGGAAEARVWEVGAGRKLTGPEAAAEVARDGDRIVFDPGIYQECAVWQASRLVIEARRPPADMKRTVMN